MKENYELKFNEIVEKEAGHRPSLLLHSCCAPCASYCLAYLIPYFDITVFFYNPNITDIDEYNLRLKDKKRLIKELNCDLQHCYSVNSSKSIVEKLLEMKSDITPILSLDQNYLSRMKYEKKLAELNEDKVPDTSAFKEIELLIGDYNTVDYFRECEQYRNEKEGGLRCVNCFNIRLKQTALQAKEKHFDYFGTTMTVSPHKDAELINVLGEKISSTFKIPFLYADFKKKDGFKKSIELSKKYNLYRQNYCGCIFSRIAKENR